MRTATVTTLSILDEFDYSCTTNTLTLFLHKGLCLYSYTAEQQNENRFIRSLEQMAKPRNKMIL